MKGAHDHRPIRILRRKKQPNLRAVNQRHVMPVVRSRIWLRHPDRPTRPTRTPLVQIERHLDDVPAFLIQIAVVVIPWRIHPGRPKTLGLRTDDRVDTRAPSAIGRNRPKVVPVRHAPATAAAHRRDEQAIGRILGIDIQPDHLADFERERIAPTAIADLRGDVSLVTQTRDLPAFFQRFVMLAPGSVHPVGGLVRTRGVFFDQQIDVRLTMVVIVQLHRFGHALRDGSERTDRLRARAFEPRVAAIRHHPLLAGIRVQIVAEDDDSAIIFLLEAKPDARFSAKALNERKRGFVKLSDVFKALIFAAQTFKIKIDAQPIVVVAQCVGNNLDDGLLLKQSGFAASCQFRNFWHQRDAIARFIRGRTEGFELIDDAMRDGGWRGLAELFPAFAEHLPQIGFLRIDGIDGEDRGPSNDLIHRDVGNRARELDVELVKLADFRLSAKS
ncbi:hypothetical protein AWB82_07264 [Caballeronia glebae]|uniref:Uncharacterized protein n=1 Tax=Caballeronia glebae TaxID=1777143 RepID=A0A158DXY0_9BURK|nr:hypothetical protein AWB82_07264 [Caballeronia glebae]